MRRVLGVGLAVAVVLGFSLLANAAGKAAAPAGGGMMSGQACMASGQNMAPDQDGMMCKCACGRYMMSGRDGMMWRGGDGRDRMSGRDGMMGMQDGAAMHKMMVGSMMMGKSMVATSDGGVIVMVGDRLLKYDANLKLKGETEIKVDMEEMHKKMMRMMERREMQEKPMTGKEAMPAGPAAK